jgi:hypothetical protein
MKNIDDRAVIGMPVYLLVAITTSSIILTVFSLSILNITKNAEVDSVKKEVEKIVSEAENMFEYADGGTVLTINVNLPNSLNKLVFGSLPQKNVFDEKDIIFDENTSNNYFFVMDDGTTNVYSSNARFTGENIEQVALLKSGTYNLVIELIKNKGKTYVKIYQK